MVNEEADEHDEEYSASISTAPASFKGRLNLSNFAFSPKDIKNVPNLESPRRSTRTSATPSPLPRASSTKRLLETPTPSPSPKKKTRSPARYAPPSTYAHLPPLPDVLAPSLICIFIGLNPGIATATTGHAYAHPSNLFWKLLHSSGCTDRRLRPEEDGSLPALYGLGNTNIVARPTRNGSELAKGEMDASVGVLEGKITRWRPEAVCVVGKGIWESVWKVRHGRKIGKGEFCYGWQKERMGIVKGEGGWDGAKVFVATSTSGLAASLGPVEKERIWRELGVWVEQRRRERAEMKMEGVS